ncbi:MAG TPA: type II secretion system F family protein [Candidatus Paceibacterota bacterium]|nr:type II secretion system F family protein [Candidatus Paceibacterota bacterium]
MLFSYSALQSDGTMEQGTKEAVTKDELAHRLSIEGKTVLHIEEAKRKTLSTFNVSLFSHISAAEKIAFAKNMSAMIKAGLPLSRALSVIERQSKNPAFKKAMTAIISDISKGGSFTAALENRRGVFSKLFIAMVRVGEESGSLSTSLSAIAFQMGKSDFVVRKVREAMIYPAIIISVMIVVFALIMIYVMPTLVATFTQFDVALPLPTQIIIATSNLFNTHLLAIVLTLCTVALLLFFVVRTRRGGRLCDWLLLHTPFVKGIISDTNSARVTRTIGSLLSAGVDMVEALEITRDVASNSYFKDVLSEAATRIQKGEPLSAILRDHTNIYPVYISETVSVGEETGDLANALESAAVFYEDEVEEKTKNISTVIEPAIMVVVGIGVAFFAIAVISPIYSLVNAI